MIKSRASQPEPSVAGDPSDPPEYAVGSAADTMYNVIARTFPDARVRESPMPLAPLRKFCKLFNLQLSKLVPVFRDFEGVVPERTGAPVTAALACYVFALDNLIYIARKRIYACLNNRGQQKALSALLNARGDRIPDRILVAAAAASLERKFEIEISAENVLKKFKRLSETVFGYKAAISVKLLYPSIKIVDLAEFFCTSYSHLLYKVRTYKKAARAAASGL